MSTTCIHRDNLTISSGTRVRVVAIDITPTCTDRFPEREQLLDWYQHAAGRSIEGIDFSHSFSSWRLTAVPEGLCSRHDGAAMGDSEPVSGAQVFVGRTGVLVAQAVDTRRRSEVHP